MRTPLSAADGHNYRNYSTSSKQAPFTRNILTRNKSIMDKIRSWLEITFIEEKGDNIPSSSGGVRIALVYPNYYHVAASSLGFQLVYQMINAHHAASAHRAFLPEPPLFSEYKRTGKRLMTLEEKRPLTDFDMIAFSVSFENDYPNILKILDLAGIPLLAKDRNETHPLIAAGGIAVTGNPEPLSDFIDVFFIGEAELVLPPFLEHYCQLLEDDLTREELLWELYHLDYIYIPSLYRVSYDNKGFIAGIDPIGNAPMPVKIARVDVLSGADACSSIYARESEFSDMHLVEISRGCPFRCGFCLLGNRMAPFRLRKFDEITAMVKKAPPECNTTGFISSSDSNHPKFMDILLEAKSLGLRASPSSLCLNSLNSELLQALKQCGNQTITLAPETASAELQAQIDKPFDKAKLENVVSEIACLGFQNLRLYFIIGLPGETDEVAHQTIELTKWIQHTMKKAASSNRIPDITLSINSFIPKAFTPFGLRPMASRRVLDERLKIIKAGLRGFRGIHVIHDAPKWAAMQALLSIGNRRVGEFLLKLHKKGNYAQAIKEWQFNPQFFINRPKSKDEIMPWSILEA